MKKKNAVIKADVRPAETETPQTLEELVKLAGKYYGVTLVGLQAFANTYVAASKLGHQAELEFQSHFPAYQGRAWRNFKLIGAGTLLPHFAFCTSVLVNALVSAKAPLTTQRGIAGLADRVGMDLTKLKPEDAYALAFAATGAATRTDMKRRLEEFRKSFQAADPSPVRWLRNGDQVRVKHRFSFGRDVWEAMGREMGWL